MKNDKKSWVGIQSQPVYPTYQTAGMLRPTPPPSTGGVGGPGGGVTPPPPSAPPIVTLPDGPINIGPGQPGQWQLPEVSQPLPPTQVTETPQDRLVAAIMGQAFGGGRRSNVAKV